MISIPYFCLIFCVLFGDERLKRPSFHITFCTGCTKLYYFYFIAFVDF